MQALKDEGVEYVGKKMVVIGAAVLQRPSRSRQPSTACGN